MTQELITELCALRSRSRNREDREFLGAVINAHEAREAAADKVHQMENCSHCRQPAPASLLTNEGVCPDCHLIYMHEYFGRRRREAFIQGW